MATDKEILQEVRDRIQSPDDWTQDGPPLLRGQHKNYIDAAAFQKLTLWDVESSLVKSTIGQGMKRDRLEKILDSCAREISGAGRYQDVYRDAPTGKAHRSAMVLLDLAIERAT